MKDNKSDTALPQASPEDHDAVLKKTEGKAKRVGILPRKGATGRTSEMTSDKKYDSGRPKTQRGRPPGSKSKDTLKIREWIQEHYPDYDPLLAMVAMSQDADQEPELKFKCHKEVCGYVYAKKKSIEVKGTSKIVLKDYSAKRDLKADLGMIEGLVDE